MISGRRILMLSPKAACLRETATAPPHSVFRRVPDCWLENISRDLVWKRMVIHWVASTESRRSPSGCKRPATLQRSLANGILGQHRRSPITVSGTFMRRTVEVTLRRTSRWMEAIRRCRRSSQRGTTLMGAVEPAAFNRPAILLEAQKVTRFSGSSRSTPLRDST